jgi:hypothetical protein
VEYNSNDLIYQLSAVFQYPERNKPQSLAKDTVSSNGNVWKEQSMSLTPNYAFSD